MVRNLAGSSAAGCRRDRAGSGPVSVTVFTLSTGWWLKDVIGDGTAAALFVEPPHPSEYTERDAEYVLLGRSDPVILTDSAISLTSGSLTILTTDQVSGLPGGCTYAVLTAMLSKPRVLLLTSPSAQWYVRVRGARKTVREQSSQGAPIRRTSITYTEVAVP